MCGFVGIIGSDQAASLVHIGLSALQHRGQDAAGIASLDGTAFHIHKGMGLVSQVFTQKDIHLPGSIAIGHTRYPTWGGQGLEEVQPFLNRYPTLMMAHNGNILEIPDWTGQGSDSEALFIHIIKYLHKPLNQVFSGIEGSYSLVLAGPNTLFGIRDPQAIRPLCYGRKGDSWMIASETVALEILGYREIKHLPGGFVVILREGREPQLIQWAKTVRPRRCVFERIYLARPDSWMEEGLGLNPTHKRVITTRGQLGAQLAQELTDIEADVVVPVPDTARPAAIAMGERLGLSVREGLIKNRYTGRTFIMPDQDTRNAALRLKLHPIREVFEGQRVILVDDSIVRGSTMKALVDMVWECEPAEIHVASMSPPVQHPCHLGINMSTYDELLAVGKTEKALAIELGATSVRYLSLEGMYKVTGNEICANCFDGVSPLTSDHLVGVGESRR